MVRNTRITEELSWSNLKERFFIGTRVSEELKRDSEGKIILKNGEPIIIRVTKIVNELQEAIDNGTLDRMIAECAEKYHNGDVQAVLVALSRNLDSQRCNMKKRAYAPNKEADELRLETLSKFISARRTSSRPSGQLPQWAYGPEEIDQIDDVTQLQKVINSINDVCCDKPGGNYASRLGPNYVEVAKANREYARKRKALLEAKEKEIPEELLAKLAKGSGRVTLSAEQAAQLLKFLSKQ